MTVGLGVGTAVVAAAVGVERVGTFAAGVVAVGDTTTPSS
jgi:hypothetical protein